MRVRLGSGHRARERRSVGGWCQRDLATPQFQANVDVDVAGVVVDVNGVGLAHSTFTFT
jgi:hypothetical protein